MRFFLFLLIGFAIPASLEAEGDETPWFSDYSAAVEIAEAEDKSLLLVFTGTDWIELCRLFDEDILSQPEFMETIAEAYVPVKLEFPKDNIAPREEAAQKQLLKDAYRVRGYPTVILSAPDGKPFGINGFQPMAAQDYANQLLTVEKIYRAKERAFGDVAAAEGLERARKLVMSIPDLPGNLAARHYRDRMEEVISLDPGDELGRTRAYQLMLADVDYSAEMQLLAKDVQWGKMIELTDRYIEKNQLGGPALQKALLNKASVQGQQANLAGRIETLLKVVEISDESNYGQEAQRLLDELRAKKLQEDLGR